MLNQTTQHGKLIAVLLFVLLSLNMAGMATAWATDSDGDGLTDAWEAAHGFNASQDNTGDAWIEYIYDTTNGDLVTTKEYIVDPDVTTPVPGLRCVSEVRKDYDELGRVWRTRRLSAPGGNVSDTLDKIDITVYDVSGRVTVVSSKSEDSTDADELEPYDLRTDKLYYDAIGRLYYTVDPADLTTLYTYTATGQLKDVYREIEGTTPLSGTRLPIINDPENASQRLMVVSTREYDDAGRVEKTIDAMGNYQTMAYNSMGQVVKTIAFDHNDTPTNYTDGAAMRQTRTEYDYVGNVTRQAVMADATLGDPCSIVVTVDNVTDYDYDGPTDDYPGKLASVSTYINNLATPQTTTYDYDDMGRVVKVTDPAGNETHTMYNDAGRVVRNWTKEVKSGFDSVYTITDIIYGTYGQAIEQRQVPATDTSSLEAGTFPLPGETGYPTTYPETSYVYNGLGQLLKVTDAKGYETTYGYNWLGKVDWTIKDSGTSGIAQRTDYGYDRLGRQIAITGYADGSDPATATHQTTAYEYNNLDQVMMITYPDTANNTVTYDYYPSGLVQERTDQRSIVTSYEYDANGNLMEKSATVSSVTYLEEFTYDGLNRMLTAKKTVGGSEQSYIEFNNYTSLGNPGSIDTDYNNWDDEKTSTFAYDQAGNLKQIDYPDSSMVAKFTPDYLGRIATISKGDTEQSQTTVATYSYIGSRVAKRVYDATGANPVTYEIDYDNLGRPESRYTYADTTNIAEFDYTFDDNGNITNQVFGHRTSDPCQVYAYDTLDRLTEADYIGGEDEAFTYDKLGNRVSVTLRNTNQETYAVDNATNQYDASGTYTVTHTYDQAGNLAADHHSYTYSYDYENRLIKIQDGAGTVADYAYDALGRRIKTVVYGTPDVTRYYFYDGGWRVLAESDENKTLKRDYIYGNYLDEVLYVRELTENKDYYYAHDHLYSPVALLEDDGTILERYEYDAYGRLTAYTDDGNDDTWFTGDDTVAAASARGNVIAFTGQRVDVLDGGDLEIMYYKNRYYDGETGRFLTRDPIGYADGMNLYQYVRSNPFNFTDIFGFKTTRTIDCDGTSLKVITRDCDENAQNKIENGVCDTFKALKKASSYLGKLRNKDLPNDIKQGEDYKRFMNYFQCNSSGTPNPCRRSQAACVGNIIDDLIDELDDNDGTQYQCHGGMHRKNDDPGWSYPYHGWEVNINTNWLESAKGNNIVEIFSHELSHLYDQTTDQRWWYRGETDDENGEPCPEYFTGPLWGEPKVSTNPSINPCKHAGTIGGWVSSFYEEPPKNTDPIPRNRPVVPPVVPDPNKPVLAPLPEPNIVRK